MADSGARPRPPWLPEPRRSSRLDPAVDAATPLRGRGPETEALTGAPDQVAAGRPALALIEGEAGIGKTRLLQCALDDALARGMQVVSGRAEELEQNRPFGLVAAAFGCVRSADDPRRVAIADLLARARGGRPDRDRGYRSIKPVKETRMSVTTEKPASTTAIRPFRADVPEEAVADLRRRAAATRWPDQETVADQSQGVQLAKLQALVRYWGTDYDWRRAEAKLNALPQFITEIDGLDIHFIHVRSPHEDALPLIVTHGWPGSVLELLKVIGPLTDPTAHGGAAQDAFHLVIPSLPGYGFSARPGTVGWNPDRIAAAWDELMKRLGYTRYVAQGGDWGAVVTEAMGRQAPTGLLGIHVNLPAAVPADVEAALAGAGPVPEMTEQERAVFDALSAYRKSGYSGYFVALTTRPQAVGYGLTDSPAGLAAFFLWHPGFAQWTFGDDPGDPKTKDEVLDDISLYWLTNTAASSGRLYWENHGASPTSATALKTAEISVPVGVTIFPEDIYRAPETWARRAYPNLTYFHEVDKGGHFAAWEQPQLFSEEIRAAFGSLR